MPVIEGTGKVAAGGVRGHRKTAVATYSFATHGGAIGDIALTSDTIPSGAILLDSYIRVTTPVTSAGAATLALKVQSAADVNAADAVTGAPWSTAAAHRGDLLATGAPVTTTAARTVVATVGTAALTAGAFTVVVEYIEFG